MRALRFDRPVYPRCVEHSTVTERAKCDLRPHGRLRKQKLGRIKQVAAPRAEYGPSPLDEGSPPAYRGEPVEPARLQPNLALAFGDLRFEGHIGDWQRGLIASNASSVMTMRTIRRNRPLAAGCRITPLRLSPGPHPLRRPGTAAWLRCTEAFFRSRYS